MTCKDCIHYAICAEEGIYFTDKYIKGATISNDVKSLCLWFKNKADFVEVVRCKDCEYCAGYMCKQSNGEKRYVCRLGNINSDGMHFCSYGKRRDTE